MTSPYAALGTKRYLSERGLSTEGRRRERIARLEAWDAEHEWQQVEPFAGVLERMGREPDVDYGATAREIEEAWRMDMDNPELLRALKSLYVDHGEPVKPLFRANGKLYHDKTVELRLLALKEDMEALKTEMRKLRQPPRIV